MSLKSEFETLIKEKNTRKSEHLQRDIQIILEYFGFGEEKFPTQESLGDKYKITKQYISNDIIKTKFKNKVRIEELPTLSVIEKILDKYNYIFYSDFLLLLTENKLIDEPIWLKGLFNLFDCFTLCPNFDIYTLSIDKASKIDIEHDEDFLIINKKIRKQIKDDVQKLLKLPGRVVGICCLNDVYEKDKSFQITFDDAKWALKNISNVWCKEIDSKFWYLVEKPENFKHDNPIITSLRKLKTLGNNFEKDVLIEVLIDTLDKLSNNFAKPDSGVVGKYLDSSRFVQSVGSYYILNDNVDGRKLNDIEVDLISYCSEHRVSSYNKISDFLNTLDKDKGYSQANINKNIYNSPFLYKRVINNPDGRETYELVFITNFSKNDNVVIEDEYQLMRNKLFVLYGETDIEREQKQRREQSILRRWLFNGKNYEKCALCGKEFTIDSLVAAHKKPRAICSENERTDPYIVMPLCKFGCDQVYEKRWIKISNGSVEENKIVTNVLSKSERDYINALIEKKIDEKWLQGDISYFDNK